MRFFEDDVLGTKAHNTINGIRGTFVDDKGWIAIQSECVFSCSVPEALLPLTYYLSMIDLHLARLLSFSK